MDSTTIFSKLPPEVLLYILSFLDLPDLANLAHVSNGLAQLADDPVLHHSRVWIVTPSRISHSLFACNAAGVPLRPTVADLVHRGIMRGIAIERRWRNGMYFSSQHMVTQYENALKLQRNHAGLVVSSNLRSRSSGAVARLYLDHILPEESSSMSMHVSPTLIPVMRRLKWSIQRDRLARFVKDRSTMASHGGAVSWLEDKDKGRLVMRDEHERVRLAVCPGIKGILRFYENLCR